MEGAEKSTDKCDDGNKNAPDTDSVNKQQFCHSVHPTIDNGINHNKHSSWKNHQSWNAKEAEIGQNSNLKQNDERRQSQKDHNSQYVMKKPLKTG